MNDKKIFELPHLEIEGLKGFWVDDDFLWDYLPRLSPLAVYIYLALGRYKSQKKYVKIKELAEELLRPERKIKAELLKLKDIGLLNLSDLKHILSKR